MGRTGTYIALAVMVLAGVLGGLASWASTGAAAEPVEIAYDHTIRTLTGRDPYTRCYELFQFYFPGPAFPVNFEQRDRGCFGPPERVTGIFIDEFEGQFFLEGVAPSSTYRIPCDWMALIMDDLSVMPTQPNPLTEKRGGRIWYVEFLGRRSPDWNFDKAVLSYGLMGNSQSALIVDEMTSAILIRTYTGYSGSGDASFIDFEGLDCLL